MKPVVKFIDVGLVISGASKHRIAAATFLRSGAARMTFTHDTPPSEIEALTNYASTIATSIRESVDWEGGPDG